MSSAPSYRRTRGSRGVRLQFVQFFLAGVKFLFRRYGLWTWWHIVIVLGPQGTLPSVPRRTFSVLLILRGIIFTVVSFVSERERGDGRLVEAGRDQHVECLLEMRRNIGRERNFWTTGALGEAKARQDVWKLGRLVVDLGRKDA